MKLNCKSFILIELIVVIAKMTNLGAIAALSFVGYIERTKEQVCNANRLQIEKMYEGHLMLENIEHTNAEFT